MLHVPEALRSWAHWWVRVLSRQLISAYLLLPATHRLILGSSLPQSAHPVPAGGVARPQTQKQPPVPIEKVGGLRGVHAPLPDLQSKTHPKETSPFDRDCVNNSLGICAQGVAFFHSGRLGTIRYTRKAGMEAARRQPRPPLQRGDTHSVETHTCVSQPLCGCKV